MVSPEGPWIVGFDDARATGDTERHSGGRRRTPRRDCVVRRRGPRGPRRGERARPPKLVTALPFLQPGALTRTTREFAGDRRSEVAGLLERLRVAGAGSCGRRSTRADPAPPPEHQAASRWRSARSSPPRCCSTRSATPATSGTAVRGADWRWVALALVFSFAANMGYAIGLMGTVPGPTPAVADDRGADRHVVLEPGGACHRRTGNAGALPPEDGRRLQLRGRGGRCPQHGREPHRRGRAVRAGRVIAPSQVDFSLLPTTGLLELTVVVVIVVALASAIVVAVPRLRRVTLPPVQRATSTMRDVLRSPYKLTLLVGRQRGRNPALHRVLSRVRRRVRRPARRSGRCSPRTSRS